MSKPWESEPDRGEWTQDGISCEMKRNHMGAWCGYVGVPEGHPWHGKHYDHIEANCHGGLTYANKADDGLWWVGFDCAHCDDLCPGMLRHGAERGEYRDQAYVTAEVIALAEQAKAAQS